ncbi:MAG TPA: GNAT family N-acetyltransferase [Kofleriaceae bacterium]
MRTLFPAPTSRISFRTWREHDLPLVRALFGDPRVSAHVGGPFDDAQHRDRLATEIATEREHGYQYWPIFLRGTGTAGGDVLDGTTHLGCCGLKPREPAQRIHELGFYLRPEYWSQGFAVEAATSVIAFAFDVLGAAALFAGHHPENTASRGTLSRLGFGFTHHELYPPTGLMHPGYELRAPPKPPDA